MNSEKPKSIWATAAKEVAIGIAIGATVTALVIANLPTPPTKQQQQEARVKAYKDQPKIPYYMAAPPAPKIPSP